jgi:hypothetical protein
MKVHSILLMYYKQIKWETFCIYLLHIYYIIQYRHSQHLIFHRMISAMKEYSIWLKCFKITRWISSITVLYYTSIIIVFFQTLTTLDLHQNKISFQGAQYLGTALQNNTVGARLWFMYYRSIDVLRNRHLKHSTLIIIILLIKEHDI